MWRGISLANKSLMLFGAAVVLIILASLAVPLVRLLAVVDETQKQLSSDLVTVWQFGVADESGSGGAAGNFGPYLRPGRTGQFGGATIVLLTGEQLQSERVADEFVRRAEAAFTSPGEENDFHEASWAGLSRQYRYARAVRAEDRSLVGIVLLSRVSAAAWDQAKVNLLYLGAAGLVALGLALAMFYLITNKIILSPVRDLKETAEMVREGNLAVRADIQTGDEFEELAETFNQMLDGIRSSQDQLRAINNSLDLKVRELDERNVELFEANKLKGDFLATVSHELRTPLNSIIGFTELLMEAPEREGVAEQDEAAAAKAAKRRRYLQNIHGSGRSLLEMINGLLEMAKVEAGKASLHLELMNVKDTCEGLVALIRPLADRGGVELAQEVASDIPNIQTDQKKFQQVIFNLLSNAVKFTSEKAQDERAMGRTPIAKVMLRAERLVGRASAGHSAEDRVRVSILDTGPGISPDDQKRIFQKFQQLDTGHTRRHEGTGLGLAISKELTAILKGEIQLESEPGRGSMFSVILPLRIEPLADETSEGVENRPDASAAARGVDAAT